ncbi:MAG: carbohydrate binding domain-containing protein [Planctomycetota bacterium]
MAYLDGETSRLQIEFDAIAILDLQSVDYSIKRNIRPRGEGIGYPSYTELRAGIMGPGTFSMKVKKRTASDNHSDIFEKLFWGNGILIRETVAVSVSTHTVAEPLVAVLEIRYNTSSNLVLKEGVDFTVNYSTGVITFTGATDAETATITYMTDAPIMGANYLENYCFEVSEVDDVWSVIATASIARSSTAAYVGTYSLAITPAAQNDGAKYDKAMKVMPNRQYRFRFAIKGTGSETFVVSYTDVAGTAAMTLSSPATAGTLQGTTFEIWEFVFTPDEVDLVDIRIVNSTAVPHVFYIDHVQLGVDDPDRTMDDGQMQPFPFNIVQYDLDGRRLCKLMGCVLDNLGEAISAVEADQEESVSGQFLRRIGEES